MAVDVAMVGRKRGGHEPDARERVGLCWIKIQRACGGGREWGMNKEGAPCSVLNTNLKARARPHDYS